MCEVLRLFPSVPLIHKGTADWDEDLVFSIRHGKHGDDLGQGLLGIQAREVDFSEWDFDLRTRAQVFGVQCRAEELPGKDISFTQVKAVAAALIYNFHIQVLPGQIVCPKFSIILYMKNGLMIKVTERCSS